MSDHLEHHRRESLRLSSLRLLWNVAHRFAKGHAEQLSLFIGRGLPDDQIIPWLPDGDVPLVVVDRFTKEQDVPGALGKTVFNNPDWWNGIRSHAREAGLILLANQAVRQPLDLDQIAESVWVHTDDWQLRHVKNRYSDLMDPFLITPKPEVAS